MYTITLSHIYYLNYLTNSMPRDIYVPLPKSFFPLFAYWHKLEIWNRWSLSYETTS